MIDINVITNRDRSYYGMGESREEDVQEFTSVLLSVNPVYDWLKENIETISFKLLKGFITNLVPLGSAGEEYFKCLVKSSFVMSEELINQYYRAEKKYIKGKLKIATYSELVWLGYTGILMDCKCPVDDVLRYVRK